MIQQEIEQEKQLNRMDDRNREINPYGAMFSFAQCSELCTTEQV